MENKYKILVLSNLTDASTQVLKSASRIAQLIEAEVELFHVRKPTKIIKNESHLSAVRELKDHYVLVEKKLETMTASISENTQLKVSHFFTFGNIKTEILEHIEKSKPDIIVLGKRMSNTPNFLGDNIFTLLLKHFQGAILVGNDEFVLEHKTKVSLGLFNSTNTKTSVPCINSIISNTDRPIRSFSIANSIPKEANDTAKEDIVSYVFEKNDQALKNMSNYVLKNKVNLLFVDRESKVSNTTDSLTISELNELVNTIKTPVLLSNISST